MSKPCANILPWQHATVCAVQDRLFFSRHTAPNLTALHRDERLVLTAAMQVRSRGITVRHLHAVSPDNALVCLSTRPDILGLRPLRRTNNSLCRWPLMHVSGAGACARVLE
eukprot:scaffold190187_cov18-Tisochrysis_lutea.AAC.1